jgi:hypothetical protein
MRKKQAAAHVSEMVTWMAWERQASERLGESPLIAFAAPLQLPHSWCVQDWETKA